MDEYDELFEEQFQEQFADELDALAQMEGKCLTYKWKLLWEFPPFTKYF